MNSDLEEIKNLLVEIRDILKTIDNKIYKLNKESYNIDTTDFFREDKYTPFFRDEHTNNIISD